MFLLYTVLALQEAKNGEQVLEAFGGFVRVTSQSVSVPQVADGAHRVLETEFDAFLQLERVRKLVESHSLFQDSLGILNMPRHRKEMVREGKIKHDGNGHFNNHSVGRSWPLE
jgi:hypothetical protein